MTTDQTPVPGSETQSGTDPTVETTTRANGETPGTKPSIDDATQKEIDRLKVSLARANKEAKDNRELAEELKRFKDQIDAEKLTETQKQEQARTELEKQLATLQKTHDDHVKASQERLVLAEVRAQAASLGFVDLNDAVQLLDRKELTPDDDGVPTNAKALLEKLLKAKPYLAGKPATQSSGGATNPSRSQTTGLPALSHAYIATLTPAQYQEMSPEQRQAISTFQRNNPHRF